MTEITRQNQKANRLFTRSIRPKNAGAEFGTQTRALHPVVAGSIPAASTVIHYILRLFQGKVNE